MGSASKSVYTEWPNNRGYAGSPVWMTSGSSATARSNRPAYPLMSAVAISGPFMISGRAVQGIGIGLSAPATLSIVVNSFPVSPTGIRRRGVGLHAWMWRVCRPTVLLVDDAHRRLAVGVLGGPSAHGAGYPRHCLCDSRIPEPDNPGKVRLARPDHRRYRYHAGYLCPAEPFPQVGPMRRRGVRWRPASSCWRFRLC